MSALSNRWVSCPHVLIISMSILLNELNYFSLIRTNFTGMNKIGHSWIFRISCVYNETVTQSTVLEHHKSDLQYTFEVFLGFSNVRQICVVEYASKNVIVKISSLWTFWSIIINKIILCTNISVTATGFLLHYSNGLFQIPDLLETSYEICSSGNFVTMKDTS